MQVYVKEKMSAKDLRETGILQRQDWPGNHQEIERPTRKSLGSHRHRKDQEITGISQILKEIGEIGSLISGKSQTSKRPGTGNRRGRGDLEDRDIRDQSDRTINEIGWIVTLKRSQVWVRMWRSSPLPIFIDVNPGGLEGRDPPILGWDCSSSASASCSCSCSSFSSSSSGLDECPMTVCSYPSSPNAWRRWIWLHYVTRFLFPV